MIYRPRPKAEVCKFLPPRVVKSIDDRADVRQCYSHMRHYMIEYKADLPRSLKLPISVWINCKSFHISTITTFFEFDIYLFSLFSLETQLSATSANQLSRFVMPFLIGRWKLEGSGTDLEARPEIRLCFAALLARTVFSSVWNESKHADFDLPTNQQPSIQKLAGLSSDSNRQRAQWKKFERKQTTKKWKWSEKWKIWQFW